MNDRTVLPAAILLSILAASKASAQALPPPALNPTTYSSPSCEYRLLVDPTEMHGRGPGTYRLTRSGREVWAGERPYTFYQAAVADDGTAAGYAYTEGIGGTYARRTDEFLVVILDPAGKERLRHATARKWSNFLHVDPDPKADGLVLDPAHDRLSVRILDPDVNRRRETWWSFELGTGKSLGELPPATPPPPVVEKAPPEPPPDGLAAVPLRKLPSLGKVVLEVDRGPKGPVREVVQMDFDGRGRVGFVRGEEHRRPTFVLAETTGRALGEVLLEAVGTMGFEEVPRCAWLDGDRWLVFTSPKGIEARSRAFVVDAGKRSVEEVRGFDCPSIKMACGLGDGGFVALASLRHAHTAEDELIAFDRDGRVRWKVQEDRRDSDNPAALFSPQAVTVTSAKEVALLCGIRKTVQLYDGKGTYLRSIDLAKAWGAAPNYPVEIASAPDGGLFVLDFEGRPPLVWMRPDGGIRARSSSPKMAGGRAAPLRNFRFAPDGRLWGSDGASAMRVTEAGAIDLVLGPVPDPARLENAAGFAIDRLDRIYAADHRTGAVHVFSPEGKQLRVCVPGPADFSAHLDYPDIAPAEDGTVYLGVSHDRGRHLQLSPEGRRIGWKEMGLNSFRESWYAQPGTGNLWVVGDEEVLLVDASGKQLRKVSRRPDGRWLEFPGPAQVAPDGSIAVGVAEGQGRNAVSIYSARGEPVRVVQLPPSIELGYGFAYAGRELVVRKGKGFFLLDGDGKPVCRIDETAWGGGEESQWFFLARGGRELWVIDSESASVHRLEMPQA
jgi:hypothetical protein